MAHVLASMCEQVNERLHVNHHTLRFAGTTSADKSRLEEALRFRRSSARNRRENVDEWSTLVANRDARAGLTLFHAAG
jgi:hypothetical protein